MAAAAVVVGQTKTSQQQDRNRKRAKREKDKLLQPTKITINYVRFGHEGYLTEKVEILPHHSIYMVHVYSNKLVYLVCTSPRCGHNCKIHLS